MKPLALILAVVGFAGLVLVCAEPYVQKERPVSRSPNTPTHTWRRVENYREGFKS